MTNSDNYMTDSEKFQIYDTGHLDRNKKIADRADFKMNRIETRMKKVKCIGLF